MEEEVKQPGFLIKEHSITVIGPSGPLTVSQGQPNWEPLKKAIKAKDWAQVLLLAEPIRQVRQSIAAENVIVTDNEVLLNGKPANGYLVNKILAFSRDGLPIEHLTTFLLNLDANPSMRAREELYKFLETEDLPVTEDGHFLAYKAVRSDWKDIHSGTIDNSVGRVVSMPRNYVDDNQDVGCSKGLHAGSIAYVRSFATSGGHYLIVKINPADVVCIPKEDCRKLRCCRYEVMQVMKDELVHATYSSDASQGFGSRVVHDDCSHDDDDCCYDREDDEDWEDCEFLDDEY